MDVLATLLGSRVRADVVAVLFGSHPRRSGLRELGRAARRPHQLVARQLRCLIDAGLVRTSDSDGRRRYEPDLTAPAGRELAALVRQTRGRVPLIRRALVTLRTPTLSWALPSQDEGSPRPASGQKFELVVLTSAPRALVRVQLADLVGRECQVQCMSVREWVARLEKGDVDLRRLRRSRKLWIRGSWEELVAAERGVLESRRLLQRAIANWQEELSDDWDDSWDPFQALPAAR